MKTCPKCGDTDIIMFDADNDMCKSCKEWFSAVADEPGATLNDLLYLFELTNISVDLPKGVLPLNDDDIVTPGDLLVDNNREHPFCLVGGDKQYADLIGATALKARLSHLCYDIYSVK